MMEISGDNVVYFDVDETLVLWNIPADYDGPIVTVQSPWRIAERLIPHAIHVDQVKKHHAAGHTVIVWTQGGWDWAKAVVEALGLERYVTAVMRKPTWYYDDLASPAFMGKPNYFRWPDSGSKGNVATVQGETDGTVAESCGCDGRAVVAEAVRLDVERPLPDPEY